MPSADPPPTTGAEPSEPQALPFPPVSKSHILHCSYHYWHPLFRSITPKARLIRLTDPFLSYLREDGILLPPDTIRPNLTDDDSGVDTFSDDEDEEETDPSTEWREIHAQIKATIAELGGKVTPKLNWSSPKDATWMSATNDLECRSANDIYLLLKSSDFITHDLEHAFDDCVDEQPTPSSESLEAPTQIGSTSGTRTPTSGQGATEHPSLSLKQADIPYYLVLRKYINLNPALEFRCFVKNKSLIGICQRDMNHFEFLYGMRDDLRAKIEGFFDEHLKGKFPDPSYVFDVYIPPPHERVWLVDINPWALRTDPLIFSWMELLAMEVPNTGDSISDSVRVRFSIGGARDEENQEKAPELEEEDSNGDSEDDIIDLPYVPEFRLVGRDDPEAHSVSSRSYSAHKLPMEVVDASRSGPSGLTEFMGQWKDILEKNIQEDEQYDS